MESDIESASAGPAVNATPPRAHSNAMRRNAGRRLREIGMWIPFLSIQGAMTLVWTSGAAMFSPNTNF
jgi:hypothetical protein